MGKNKKGYEEVKGKHLWKALRERIWESIKAKNKGQYMDQNRMTSMVCWLSGSDLWIRGGGFYKKKILWSSDPIKIHCSIQYLNAYICQASQPAREVKKSMGNVKRTKESFKAREIKGKE